MNKPLIEVENKYLAAIVIVLGAGGGIILGNHLGCDLYFMEAFALFGIIAIVIIIVIIEVIWGLLFYKDKLTKEK